MQLVEYYYESGNAPHEALGRAARRLSQGGALYLGGGVGIEKTSTKDGDRYAITQSGSSKPETFAGPLSAAMRGFAVAGASTAGDTPGGASKVTDPAAAARLRELNDEEKELERRISRAEARIAAKNAPGTLPQSPEPQAWEQRELAEDKSRLTQLRAERKRLLDTGKVEEVETARPGTNFTKIPPQNVKKLSPIIKHYAGMAHPFTACVKDQMKHGLSQDHANRRCAVVKDLGRGTTKWRSKEAERHVAAVIAEACGRLDAIDSQLGAGAAIELAEGAGGFGDPKVELIAEGAFADLGMLMLAEHPLGVVWQEMREAFEEKLHPRNFLGRFRKKVGNLNMGDVAHAPGGITVTRHDSGYEVKGGAGLGAAKAATETHSAPNIAAMMATNRSLRSRDAKSLGGATHYPSFEAYEKEHGKPKGTGRVTRPLPEGTPGIADTPGEHARDHEAEKHFDRARGPRSRYAAEKLTPEQRAAGERRAAERAGISKQDFFRLSNDAGALSGERTRSAISDDDLDRLIKGQPIHAPGAKSKAAAYAREKKRRERAARASAPGVERARREHDQVKGREAEVRYNKRNALTRDLKPGDVLAHSGYGLVRYDGHAPQGNVKVTSMVSTPRGSEEKSRAVHPGELSKYDGPIEGAGSLKGLSGIRASSSGGGLKVGFERVGGDRDAAGGTTGETAKQTAARAKDTAQDADDTKLIKMGPTKKLSVPEKHQLRIARQTLRMSDAGSRIMGGMSKDEARKFIRRVAGK